MTASTANDVAASAKALTNWLERLEHRAPESHIKLGLERVQTVYGRLSLDLSSSCIITVGGTNGKGSTVRLLEQMYCAAGHSCLAYTSPHLLTFAERYRLNGDCVHDRLIVDALATVERARQDTFLTYFEQVTLAAFWLADRLKPDVLLLEVGLGGRLDAVNAIDADVTIITSIGLDHQAWLGPTRASIGLEKAGIARAGVPLILAEKHPPDGMLKWIDQVGARLLRAGRELNWRWTSRGVNIRIQNRQGRFEFKHIIVGLAGRHQAANLTAAIAAVLELQSSCPVSDVQIRIGAARTRLPGRFEQVLDEPPCYIDVAHNLASVRALRSTLQGYLGRTLAVFAALDDKPVARIVMSLNDVIDQWYVAGLPGPRGRSSEQTLAGLQHAAVKGEVIAVKSVPEAIDLAL
ncbi:MAG: Mur ligase family protein, partial [Pseudomonadota bacterium]